MKNKKETKKLLLSKAKEYFPEIPKEEWLFVINEYMDGDFNIKLIHNEEDKRYSILTIRKKVIILEEELIHEKITKQTLLNKGIIK